MCFFKGNSSAVRIFQFCSLFLGHLRLISRLFPGLFWAISGSFLGHFRTISGPIPGHFRAIVIKFFMKGPETAQKYPEMALKSLFN